MNMIISNSSLATSSNCGNVLLNFSLPLPIRNYGGGTRLISEPKGKNMKIGNIKMNINIILLKKINKEKIIRTYKKLFL